MSWEFFFIFKIKKTLNPLNKLELFLKANFSLSEDELKTALDCFQPENFKKNEIILHAGKICHYMYFVSNGLLRTYHVNANGTEFTRLFAAEDSFCTILLSFQERIASPACIQALENSSVLKISREDFRTFLEKSENAKRIYTKILEDFQNFQIKRIEFLTQYTPQEKVEIFHRENPELEKRLANKVIASYLQITPETYSRCKKKLLC